MTVLDPARLAEGAPVEVHEVLASTQARAKEMARAGAPHGFAVFADRQEKGRGRLGRVWESAGGTAVLTTVVVRPALEAARAPLLCLAAAVACIEAIEATRPVAGAPYGIKWPNDVLAPDGAKVAGILAECEPQSDGGLAYALLGIGINVHAAPDLATATCLDRVEGTTRDRTALARALRDSVVAWSDRLVGNPAEVLDRWRRDQVTLGCRVRIGDVCGEAIALEPSGALRLRDDHGQERSVTTGDVEMIGRA